MRRRSPSRQSVASAFRRALLGSPIVAIALVFSAVPSVRAQHTPDPYNIVGEYNLGYESYMYANYPNSIGFSPNQGRLQDSREFAAPTSIGVTSRSSMVLVAARTRFTGAGAEGASSPTTVRIARTTTCSTGSILPTRPPTRHITRTRNRGRRNIWSTSANRTRRNGLSFTASTVFRVCARPATPARPRPGAPWVARRPPLVGAAVPLCHRQPR